MLYTVKQVAQMAGVTIKTLHHYHRIGLLPPAQVSQAGYRHYGQREIERLQEILFFRALDFALADIARALADGANRAAVLTRQRGLLLARIRRLVRLIGTLDESLAHAERREPMPADRLFEGLDEAGWRDALAEQADYLKERYGYGLGDRPIEVERLNEVAQEVAEFQATLAEALRQGISHRDGRVAALLADHVASLNAHGIPTSARGLVQQVRYLVEDDFHRHLLEAEQVGLATYYLAAAQAYAASETSTTPDP